MTLPYDFLFPAMWFGYLGYWGAMSAKVTDSVRSEPASSRMTRLVLMICAFALLWLPRTFVPVLDRRFLPSGGWCFWSGAAVTAAGLLFSVWERNHLGRNWSQAVTVKDGHKLITSGPYAAVRHPIYTGLLLAFLGTAIARAEWRGLLALLLVFVAIRAKMKLEEQWMRAQFGESYESYSRRVAALVPYIF